MIECWICGKLFEPDPEKVKAWAESDRGFDGTDWECRECIQLEYQDDDSYYEDYERQCPYCAGEDKDPEGLLSWCPYCDHGVIRW